VTLLSKKKMAAAAADVAETPKPKWLAQNRWNHMNRDALKAHSKVKQAVKAGTLKRGKCWCGSLRTEAHHSDYSKPLDVEWLCRKHHRAVHAAQRRAAKLAEAA
jgi:hypothetical protein